MTYGGYEGGGGGDSGSGSGDKPPPPPPDKSPSAPTDRGPAADKASNVNAERDKNDAARSRGPLPQPGHSGAGDGGGAVQAVGDILTSSGGGDKPTSPPQGLRNGWKESIDSGIRGPTPARSGDLGAAGPSAGGATRQEAPTIKQGPDARPETVASKKDDLGRHETRLDKPLETTSKVTREVTELAKTLAKSAETAKPVSDALGKSWVRDTVAGAARKTADLVERLHMKDSVTKLKEFTDTKAFKAVSKTADTVAGTIEGAHAAKEAQRRGVSEVGAVVDAAETILAEKIESPIDTVFAGIDAVAKTFSTKAGEVTGVLKDMGPKATGLSLVQYASDTIDAVRRGDRDQLMRQGNQNLEGKYGEVLRGYGIAFDAVGAALSGDRKSLNGLLDAAAGGTLGAPAKAGDWLGDRIFRVLHRHR